LNNKLLKIGSQILLIWGGVSLISVLLLIGYLGYSITLGNTNSENSASKSDVRFVLNWSELGDERIEKVIKSYESARWFTGDHLDAYAIKITDISISELSSTQTGKWYQVDSLPEILDDAVSLIGEWQYEIPWFPSEEKLRNDEFYVYPWSIYCHGVKPSSVQLIFLKPDEKMVYYISVKM
jgi:hypothetical protein